MLMLFILLLLSSNAVLKTRDKSILYVGIVITIVITIVISFFFCINSYSTDLQYIDSDNISGQLSHTVNVTNHPQYLVSLIRGFFLEEFLFLLVFTLLYNFSKVKRLVFTFIFSLTVPVFLGLICLANKLPAFYFLEQLGCAPLGYLISALFIFLISNIRLGLDSKPLSFSYSKFKFSLLILLIVVILNITGVISNLYGEIWSFLGCVFSGTYFSLSVEVKQILTVKSLQEVWSSDDLKKLSSLSKIKYILTNIIKFFFGEENQKMFMGDNGNLPVNRTSKQSEGLIPKTLLMEGEPSGSQKRGNPYLQDENAPLPRKPRIASKFTLSAKTYVRTPGYPIRTNKWGMEYIPCPEKSMNHEIGEAGNLKRVEYYNGFQFKGSTVSDTKNLLAQGWCSDGSRSNQPTARNIADILLAAKEIKGKWVHNSFFESPLVLPFIKKAMNTDTKNLNISANMIIALRSSD